MLLLRGNSNLPFNRGLWSAKVGVRAEFGFGPGSRLLGAQLEFLFKQLKTEFLICDEFHFDPFPVCFLALN